MKKIQQKLGAKLKRRDGFTLIEMLIVVAIIAVLVLVSIPLVTTSLEKARKATDDANLRAAKAVAVMEYLGNDKVAEADTTYYYDIKTGELTEEQPEGYNQSKGVIEGSSVEAKTQVIKVTLPTTALNESESAGKIKCEWVAGKTTTP